MSEKTEKAAFSFINHKVRKFIFSTPDVEPEGLMVEFRPSGEYNQKKGIFKLILIFEAKFGEKNEETFAEITAEGYFKFENSIEIDNIPDFFYANSIAILFPYLRAFVTVLTSVGNVKPLILPTMNLMSLAEPLKNSTVVIV